MAGKSSSRSKVYRDSKTGRFVSQATYNRSVAHGGSRYRSEKRPLTLAQKAAQKAVKPRIISTAKEFESLSLSDYLDIYELRWQSVEDQASDTVSETQRKRRAT